MKIIPQTNISNKVVLLHSNVLIGSDNNDKSQCYSHILLGPPRHYLLLWKERESYATNIVIMGCSDQLMTFSQPKAITQLMINDNKCLMGLINNCPG